MEETIVNKVNQSGLLQIDLEELRPQGERVFFDLAPHLFMGQVLKEKDFRQFISEHDWTQYAGKHIAIGCSEEAIIPTWAFMLLSIQLNPYVKTIIYGDLQELEKTIFQELINKLNPSDFEGARVVVKGCSKESIPTDAYVQLSHKLQPIVKSLFFGEPCSTVPLYKKK